MGAAFFGRRNATEGVPATGSCARRFAQVTSRFLGAALHTLLDDSPYELGATGLPISFMAFENAFQDHGRVTRFNWIILLYSCNSHQRHCHT
jgi:hypothetical protein